MRRSSATVTRIIGIGETDMISDRDIREQLLAYLQDDLDLDAFVDWIAQNTWNVHQWGDPDTKELAYAIETRLAEHSGGHISEQDLQNNLLPLVQRYAVSIDYDSGVQTSSSYLLTETQVVTFDSVDAEPVEVSAS